MVRASRIPGVVFLDARRGSPRRSKRANLSYSIRRVSRRLGGDEAAGVYMSGVLDYLTAELVELAGDRAVKRARDAMETDAGLITAEDVFDAIKSDDELGLVGYRCQCGLDEDFQAALSRVEPVGSSTRA